MPIDGANLMLTEDCIKSQNQTSLSETETVVFDDITHCPINIPGQKVKAHIF